MYNGIGLLTARGSGTSGYVSTNKFNLRGEPRSTQAPGGLDAEGPKQKKANQDILEHNRKRDIEAKVFELHDQLEEEGMDDIQIELECQNLRDRLTNEAQRTTELNNVSMETHEVAVRKERQMDKLASAFGIRDVKEGDAFNSELQAKLKEDRRLEREEREKNREKEEKERAKALKKAEKERKKAAKEAEEDRLKRLEKEREEEMQRRAQEEEAARRAAMPPSPFSDRFSPEAEDPVHLSSDIAPQPPLDSATTNGVSRRLRKHLQSVIVVVDERKDYDGKEPRRKARAGSSPPAKNRSPTSSVPTSRSRSASPSPPKARVRNDSPNKPRAAAPASKVVVPPPPDERLDVEREDTIRGRDTRSPVRRRRSSSPPRRTPPKRSRHDSPPRRYSPPRRERRSPVNSRRHRRSSRSSSSGSGSSSKTGDSSSSGSSGRSRSP